MGAQQLNQEPSCTILWLLQLWSIPWQCIGMSSRMSQYHVSSSVDDIYAILNPQAFHSSALALLRMLQPGIGISESLGLLPRA